MRLVVFDLDHTLLNANSSFSFGIYLFRQNFFSRRALIASLLDFTRHKWMGMSLAQLHERSFSRLFKGKMLDEVRSHVHQFLKFHFQTLLYAPVVQRLKEAQATGNIVLILSASPDFLVREIATLLKIDSWKGTTYLATPEGRFCSISDVMEGERKACFVQEFARSLSLPLSSVTAYSDSHLDLPLLKLAGESICVCPSSQLKSIGLNNGWEILSE